MTVTMLIMCVVTAVLYHLNLITMRNPVILIITFAITCIAIGTAFSLFVGKRFLAPVVQLSEATQKIAKGDFSVTLDENVRSEETRTMAHNFNAMTKELTQTEMFRNDFIENVSHEFKTPLSAIEGYVTLLQRRDLSEDKRKEYTERILQSTKRLSALTGNILLLSRLENQEIEVKKEIYSLDEQLRETILLLENRWSEKNIELEIDLETVDYKANRELLAQVWQNILTNAIKFTQKKGKISVVLRVHPSEIRVTITDNGHGMSAEVIGRIYEKFYQGDVSRASAGNGLGLTLAKRIIDLHHGRISVSSEEGRGSTFTVSLPL